MTAAACTADLDTAHAVAIVFDIGQMVLVERSVERRPASAGMKFLLRAKEWQAAETTGVNAVHLVVQKRSAECRLSAVVEKYAAFLCIKILCESPDRFLAQRCNVVTGI